MMELLLAAIVLLLVGAVLIATARPSRKHSDPEAPYTTEARP